MATVTLEPLTESVTEFLKEQWRIGDTTLVERRFGYAYSAPVVSPDCCPDCALQVLRSHAREWITAVYRRLNAR